MLRHEKFIGDDFLEITILRSKGHFGTVSVGLQISKCSENLTIVPVSLWIMFKNFETSRNASFEIPDELPAKSLSCTFRIANVSTSDLTYDVNLNHPKIDELNSEVVIFIYPGDAFVRFSKASYLVKIDSFASTLQLLIYRGVHSKNNSVVVGSLNLPATVTYFILPQTAQYGIDFQAANSSLGFGPGISSVFLPISILPGNNPKKTKYFKVELKETTGNIVLSDPYIADIFLVGDDMINGILSWKETNISMEHGSSVPLIEFSAENVRNVYVWSVRRGGLLGFVSVQWELTLDEAASGTGKDVAIGIKPIVGLLVFKEGESIVSINFTVSNASSNQLRPLKLYRLRMMPETATGGAVVQLNESMLYVLDRDCGFAYGVITLNESLSFHVAPESRTLEIKILRIFGRYEDVLVDFGILHSEIGTIFNGLALIPDGRDEVKVSIPLRSDVFIKLSSYIRVFITHAKLRKELPFGPYNSPLIGNVSSINVTIPDNAANGVIRFNFSKLDVSIERDGLQKLIQVPLIRDGSFGKVKLIWRVLELEKVRAWNVSFLDDDFGNFTGSVTLLTGQSHGYIKILLEKYNVTSLSERFYIEIVDWEPKSVAKLNTSAALCIVVLPELGKLAGFFRFCPWMADSFVVAVEKDSVEVCILRSGDVLVNASVLVSLEPNGDAKFYGGRTVVYFQQVEMMKRITVVARDDGIPQLNITYKLKLSPYGSRRAEIDDNRNLTITVLPHSYPFGIVEFPAINLTVAITLQNNQSHYGANFPVRRFKGGFSRAAVEWVLVKINADEKIDFHLDQGIITFEEHQIDSLIRITFTASNMPRFSKTFAIYLINSTNGSILGENVRAFLNVVGLDYSVHFNESIVSLFTPGSYQVTIVREGPLANKSLVKCRTQSLTAIDGRDFVAFRNETLEFDIGVSMQHLNISLLDDPYPRPDRIFYVVFYDVEGAIVPTNNLMVVVKAKHHSSGIFRFVPSFNKTAQKGSEVTFQIMREKGSFGKATVFYEIYRRDCNSSLAKNGTNHFSNSSGRVDFLDRQSLADLVLNILADDVPEFYVCYSIDLAGVLGGPSYDPAILSDGDLEMFLIIAPSNFPFGKIYLEPKSQQVSIAEDINNNNVSNVSNNAKLVVLRSNGALDYKRDPHLEEFTSWEVYSYQITSALTFPVVVDMLLLATRSMTVNHDESKGIQVTSSEARIGTGTNVIRFSGCDGCYVSVNVDRNISLDAFSVVVWMKSFTNNDLISGCILSKVLNAFLDYSICLRSYDRFRSDLLFYYSTNAKQSSQYVVNLHGNSISDGIWHFLVVQIFNSSIVVFLDNSFINQSALSNMKVTSIAGDYLVGGMSSNQNNFFGSMQDLRIYGQRLNDLLMQELYVLPSRKDVELVSGYLIFNTSNQSEATIDLRSIDNSIPEPNKVFTVKLLDCSGPSGVSTVEDVAILTILKSDNANGLFGLDNSCINSLQNLGPSSVTCPVMRQKGTFDSVAVVWKVENVDVVNGYNSAGYNFLDTVGSITFEPGVIQKNISLYLTDDWLPKLKQQFRVVLVSVASSDGLLGSTSTSGASINPSASSCTIPLQERNFPFGFFEFSQSQEKLSSNETFLRAVLIPLTVRINENMNVLRMYVIRHQGLVGGATVEWKTVEGTAKSRETSPDYDFGSSAGLLMFDSGQLSMAINISIYQPKSIKSDREFKILLNNSQPSIGSGCGPEVTIIISASQKAFGVFGFDANSLEVHVSKDSIQINDTISAHFVVRRYTGSLGFVTLQWSMFCPSGELNTSSLGFLDFSSNQTSNQLIFKITNNGQPSLKSFCFVELLNASQGIIDYSKSNATLVLMPSNDPYGKFIIASPSRFMQVESSDQNVSVTVERISGSYGTVKVTHSTLTPEELYSYLPSNVLRATKDDFRSSSGDLLFSRGQRIGYFNVTIRKTYLPSLDASVFARLTTVSLVVPEQSDPVANSPRLGASVECLVRVEIKSHDFPHGVLQLSSNEVKVHQNFSSPLGYVVRSAGSVGQVSIKFEVIPDTAQAGINFVVSSNIINFGNGETRQPLPVSVVNTLMPQPELKFFIRLLNDSATGEAVVGEGREMVVIIERSWDAAGVFGFDEDSSILMEENLESKMISHLLIVRSRGSQGLVTVFWTTNSSVGARLSSPPAGQIFFLSSETKHVLTLEFLPRSIDEPIKVVDLLIDID